jgi:hypothetical protein
VTSPRGYSWPPFDSGNQVALKSGAYSPRKLDPLTEELVERLVTEAAADGSRIAYLRDGTFIASIWGWARAEARVLLLTAHFDEIGWFGEEGQARPGTETVTRWETLAMNQRDKLGLDPTSRSRLLRDLAATATAAPDLLAALAARRT